MALSIFQPAVLGMKTQSHALGTISNNVANVSTGGYKRTDTRFETLISKTIDGHSDLGGVKPKDYQRIQNQGSINGSARDLDLAINGDGFFYVSPTFDVGTEIFFTRDGSFEMSLADAQTSSVTADDNSTITIQNGYLTDKNGYYVLGTAADPTTGLFSSSGTLEPIRIDEWAFVGQSTPTTTASVGLNLPSNNEIVSNHSGVVLAANAGTNNENLETYAVNLVDSLGNTQTAQLNFTKSSNNVWQVSATTSRAQSPQVDSLVIEGTAETNDSYSVTVDGNTVSYTTTGAEGSLSAIRDAFVAAINADATVSGIVTASAGNAGGGINLTAVNAATAFTTTAAATDGTRPQQDSVVLEGVVELGDQYSVTVNGSTVTYTVTGAEANLAEVQTNFMAAINADPTVSAIVSAAAVSPAPSATQESFTLTAIDTNAGTFTATVATPVTGATIDNTATISTTLAALVGTKDNGVSIGTKTNYQTTAPTTLTFSGDGVVVGSPPTPLNFSVSFATGATSTFTLDVEQMTQFGSDFLASRYSHNGLESANMTRVRFDDAGQVIGSFTDSTERAIYKLPLAIFANPDQLEMKNGMVFDESPNSGSPVATFADTSGQASFVPNAYEGSNVDLATEFTRMIVVQKAYNSSATVFRTVDEMVGVARDLKS